ncbi:thiamine-phosphate pyrophosphorylase [Barnesiella viscericola DSM 18177]|uniref:Thiamine-phosphate synthase n=2 Tax=Barnesiella viscericola TaxID=397865 RepID=W0EL77_9BACT|nr:thiamine-phosphate pyrophosphorylase [Barnesiella viscericola DSM 18177]
MTDSTEYEPFNPIDMLQFITHQTLRFGIVEGAVAALKGGCKWIQLRMKEAPLDEVERTARELIPLCQEHEAILVLDDYPQLAADLDVDGVHLGKLDMPVSEARLLIGEKYIIGGTANTFDDIQSLVRQDADYVGLGPFRFTETKKNLSPILGLEGYARIMRQCRENDLKIPVVAIGGITADDIPALMETGVSGIALSGTILQAEDPEAETRKIIDLLNQYRKV